MTVLGREVRRVARAPRLHLNVVNHDLRIAVARLQAHEVVRRHARAERVRSGGKRDDARLPAAVDRFRIALLQVHQLHRLVRRDQGRKTSAVAELATGKRPPIFLRIVPIGIYAGVLVRCRDIDLARGRVREIVRIYRSESRLASNGSYAGRPAPLQRAWRGVPVRYDAQDVGAIDVQGAGVSVLGEESVKEHSIANRTQR